MATKLTKNESALENLAAESGVAIVVLDKSGTERTAANNNSICRDLYPSPEFGPKCAEFCGRAMSRSIEAGGVIEYRCHGRSSHRIGRRRNADHDGQTHKTVGIKIRFPSVFYRRTKKIRLNYRLDFSRPPYALPKLRFRKQRRPPLLFQLRPGTCVRSERE